MTAGSWPDLPPLLAEIADIVGVDAMLRIAEAKGGQSVMLNATLRDDNWLVAAIGREKAELLARHLTSGARVKLEIPFGPTGHYLAARRRSARLLTEAFELGANANAAARQAGVTNRSARRFRSKQRTTEKDAPKLL